eukprot:scaffold4280_cov385-Prasinococcus_capsulatus_cf.AAC.12
MAEGPLAPWHMLYAKRIGYQIQHTSHVLLCRVVVVVSLYNYQLAWLQVHNLRERVVVQVDRQTMLADKTVQVYCTRNQLPRNFLLGALAVAPPHQAAQPAGQSL